MKEAITLTIEMRAALRIKLPALHPALLQLGSGSTASVARLTRQHIAHPQIRSRQANWQLSYHC
jgi:hypothetical protein